MDWFNTGFYRDFGYGLVYPQILPDYRYDGAQAEVLRRAEARSRRWLEILDTLWLGRSAFLCGEAVTIADLFGAAYVSIGDWIGYDLSPYPNVVRWLAAMRARPSWTASHEAWNGLVANLREPQAA
jgi:glutathione S-transferase